MEVTQLLEKDHRKVEKLFAEIKASKTTAKKQNLFSQIYHELSVHAVVEEQVFYPALAAYKEFKSLLKDAYKEHAEAKLALSEIAALDPASEEWTTKVEKLEGDIQHHVKDEEEKLFPKVRETVDEKELARIGSELNRAKSSALNGELLSQPLYLSSTQSQPTA